MKKYFILGLMALLSVMPVRAVTQTWVIPSGAVSNLFSSSVVVKQFYLTGTNATLPLTVYAFDVSSTVLTNVVSAYSNMVSYATNLPTSYVNFFGLTNTYTNLVLVDITNSVAAATNTAPVSMVVVANGVTQTRIDNVSFNFSKGLTITNAGTGQAVVTLGWQQ